MWNGNGQIGLPNGLQRENSRIEIDCDDCGHTDSLFRWCETCHKATCAACVLDDHKSHNTTNYLQATRDESKALDEHRNKLQVETSKAVAKREKTDRVQKEIVFKIDVFSAKISKLTDTAIDLCRMLEQHSEKLNELIRKPLTGKTVCDRRNAVETTKLFIENLSTRLTGIISQLNYAKKFVNETYGKYGGESKDGTKAGGKV